MDSSECLNLQIVTEFLFSYKIVDCMFLFPYMHQKTVTFLNYVIFTSTIFCKHFYYFIIYSLIFIIGYHFFFKCVINVYTVIPNQCQQNRNLRFTILLNFSVANIRSIKLQNISFSYFLYIVYTTSAC